MTITTDLQNFDALGLNGKDFLSSDFLPASKDFLPGISALPGNGGNIADIAGKVLGGGSIPSITNTSSATSGTGDVRFRGDTVINTSGRGGEASQNMTMLAIAGLAVIGMVVMIKGNK